MPLQDFRNSLPTSNPIETLRKGLIGEGLNIPGSEGDVPLIYADYVASGRALTQVEDFILDRVLPYYANSHTEDSFCGSYITRLREAARAEIARLTGADKSCTVVFAGSGATAGLNRLVGLLGINEAESPVVLHGPYEHHSNILPWRESKAQVIEVPEGEGGGPDLKALETLLCDHAEADLVIGSFSAASNVTGIVTDVAKVTRLLKSHGAKAVWDYAGGGPYLAVDMASDTDAALDAVVISAHKFPGGPGASGVLILRNEAVRLNRPTWPGGGTVSYVSPWAHDYVNNLAEREEAGTPNILGDIRAALVFLVKEAIGPDAISRREAELNALALKGWEDNPHLTLLGTENPHRLPIFAFLVRNREGQIQHHKTFTTRLSDLYGVQARGGCACAGPYGHRLLNVDRATSEMLRGEVLAGQEMSKPGWVRLNFSYLMDDITAQYIIDSVNALSARIGTEDTGKRTGTAG
jgi:selenocysteine lyase/cysteine desulfurase